jgi:hypothetical protein
MFGDFFSAIDLTSLELSHWLIVTGGALTIIGAIGTLISGRQAMPVKVAESEVDGPTGARIYSDFPHSLK